jgi:peptidoglycan hydrolase CwlO-like protein
MFEELRDTVTKEDFRILRESIDANVSRLDGAITRLAEAQARTEVKVGELAEGQSRLAAAQARTEERIDELAQAQARTEERMNELAQAQARTEVRMDECERRLKSAARGGRKVQRWGWVESTPG